jgi:hypothetical protein
MNKQHGIATGTKSMNNANILLNTLAFSPSMWIWAALELGFQCVKKHKFALFSFALGAFAYFRNSFSSCFRALFCDCER